MSALTRQYGRFRSRIAGARTAARHPSDHWLRTRITVIAVILALLLVGAGVAIVESQSNTRDQLEARFSARMALGAGFVRSFMDDVMTRERAVAAADFSDGDVPAGDLSRIAPVLGFDEAVLLNSSGDLLQVVPDDPSIVGEEIATNYPQLTAAEAGQSAVSGVVPAATDGSPVIAVAIPFDTPAGRRVLSGAFSAKSSPLAAYLRAAVPQTIGTVYLVDAANNIVASNQDPSGSEAPTGIRSLTGPLGNVPKVDGAGFYSDPSGNSYYSVDNVENTPLRIVATISNASLFGPVEGPTQWIPWLVLGLLVLGAIYLVFILRSFARAQAQLRQTSVELERSNRELQDFATIASHDLQEPLRKIQAFGERLQTQTHGTLDETSADYLTRMMDAAGRMQQLIAELLSYSRVTSRPEAFEPVDLNRTLGEIVDDLEVRIQSTGGEVIVGRLPVVMASRPQMRQLFQNLIANALKFHRPDVPPLILVGADMSGKADWAITVMDNGIGFDEQYVERIFAPFQRLHGRSSFEGTGMGLAITRRIVERHGGQITAQSEPGNGATFVIDFPRQMVVPSMASSRRAGQPQPESAQAG